ncbi:MAG TPA: T9SS type A sorting domain-containing protein [Cryomorphaceae bacterium]|nr:T9SS type A sorting domain-containing protein [Cryomorphaceae bacterium]
MKLLYKNRIIGLSLIIFSLISFKSFGQFDQILNNNINYEVAMHQAYYNGFGDVSSESEIAMLMQATDPNGDFYDPFCVTWNCADEPCTFTFDESYWLMYATGQSFDATFDLKMTVMEDDNATPCVYDEGDDDYYNEIFAKWNSVPDGPFLASVVFMSTSQRRWSSEWYINHNSEDGNWLFPEIDEWNLQVKSAWRFSAGDNCADPLNFGLVGPNSFKNNYNSTSQVLAGDNSGNASLSYTNTLDNSSSDIFYAFQLDQTMEVDISTISGTTDFDTYLRLYDQNCSNLIALNDDQPGTQNQSQIIETLGPGNYVVQVEGYNTANGKFQLQIQTGDVVVSTENSNKPERIGVYPNPTSDLIQIDLDDSYGDNSVVKIFDITGKLVHQESTNGQNKIIVPVSGLSAGTYQVLIQSDQKIAQSKFVVQR